MRHVGAAGALLIGVSLVLGGCIARQGTLDAASFAPDATAFVGFTRAAPIERREVIGRDARITSVLLVPTFDGPRLERAMDDALARAGGDTLVGVRVRTIESWFLVGWSVLEVRGDVADLATTEVSR